MFPKSIITALLLAGWAAPALAQSDCLKALTTLDHHLALGVTASASDAGGGPAAAQEAPAPTTGAPPAAASSQLDTVPNTGGVVDRPPDQLAPLSADRKRQVTALLEEAKAADSRGDGTICADRLRQARQLAQQPSDTPSDLH